MRDTQGLLVTIALVAVLIVYGPQLAAHLGTSIDQITNTLKPYVLTVLGVIGGLLLVRGFWRSRY